MTNTTALTQQEKQLREWVFQNFPSSALPTDMQLTPISGDAGFRRYYRFASPSQWLAVDAPPQTEDSQQFIALAQFLSHHGVNTPRILSADIPTGFLLVEDFGDELLFAQLDSTSVDTLYQAAFKTLLRLQACPDNTALVPRYDQVLLRRELLIFSEWFASKLLGYTLHETEINLLTTLFGKLENSALEQPQTLVHRDFHSRNLIIRNNQPLGVIDFQGALWGACTYDVASLLRDCYVRWPAAQVKNWALSYRSQAIAAGLLPENITANQYLRWFDWIGLQRHIKVLGIFARLHLRDNKDHYLRDLPLVIRYTLEVADTYPDLQPFGDWFRGCLLPLAEQQPWYCDYQTAGGPA